MFALRYDLPGIARPRSYSENLAAHLTDVFALYKIGRAHVAGISPGGLIAQAFAASWSDLVDRLILVDTTPHYVDEIRAMWDVRAATARTSGVAATVGDLLKYRTMCRATEPAFRRVLEDIRGLNVAA